MGTIVIGHDGSVAANEALEFAAAEAALRGCSVLVVESWTDPVFGVLPGSPASELDGICARVERELDLVMGAVAAAHPAVPFERELATGQPADVLLAASHDAELLVVGSRGRGGFSSLQLGSVSRQVAAASRVPVVVVRGLDAGRAGTEIVVGVDGSGAGREALAWAGREAHLRELPLRVVLTWSHLRPEGIHGTEDYSEGYDESSAESTLCTIVRDVLGGDPEVGIHLESRRDLPARVLVERSARAALLVVGSRPPSVQRLFNSASVALQVLPHAACPVAVVPGDAP